MNDTFDWSLVEVSIRLLSLEMSVHRVYPIEVVYWPDMRTICWLFNAFFSSDIIWLDVDQYCLVGRKSYEIDILGKYLSVVDEYDT